ncbi:unnamed protein product [Umbelopsis ramanniana]
MYMAVDAAPILPTGSWNPPDFRLDLSGVAAVVGGEEAVAATLAAFTTGNSWLIGAYAPPGAYVVARFFGRSVWGPVWNSIFPGERYDLAAAFHLHAPSGYRYHGLCSEVDNEPFSNIPDRLVDAYSLYGDNGLEDLKGKVHDMSAGQGTDVLLYIFSAEDGWHNEKEVYIKPNRILIIGSMIAFIFNSAICVILILMDDWLAVSIILAGMVINFLFMGTMSSFKITVLKHKLIETNCLPPGHGIFYQQQPNDPLMAVFGSEDSVNSISKSRLSVREQNSNIKLGIGCIAMYLLFLAQRQIVKDNCGAKCIAVLRGQRIAPLVMTLAFLTNLKSEAWKSVYNSLLWSPDTFRSVLDCVDDSIQRRELVMTADVKASWLHNDLVDAWEFANTLKQTPDIQQFLKALDEF